MKAALFIASAFSIASVSASAAVLNANPTNFASVFAAARDGDTIKASGTFGAVSLRNRTFATGITLDATDAVFTNTMMIQNVTGLKVLRGTYGSRTQAMSSGRAIIVSTSANVTLQNNTFIGNGLTPGIGNLANHGVLVQSSNNVKVSAGNFSNLYTGIGVGSSTNVHLDSSKFTGMTSDGINIADSHFVTAIANTCVGSVPFFGAHPDCIQLWSLTGRPVQSDITLQGNYAYGDTQGFASYNPEAGGGLRISMIGNIVETTYGEGITCYNCTDSIFRDNLLSTLPGSLYRTIVNISGGGNNIIANNTIGLKGAPLPLATLAMRTAATAVPEPSEWAMLIVGFGLIGAFKRRSTVTLHQRAS